MKRFYFFLLKTVYFYDLSAFLNKQKAKWKIFRLSEEKAFSFYLGLDPFILHFFDGFSI